MPSPLLALGTASAAGLFRVLVAAVSSLRNGFLLCLLVALLDFAHARFPLFGRPYFLLFFLQNPHISRHWMNNGVLYPVILAIHYDSSRQGGARATQKTPCSVPAGNTSPWRAERGCWPANRERKPSSALHWWLMAMLNYDSRCAEDDACQRWTDGLILIIFQLPIILFHSLPTSSMFHYSLCHKFSGNVCSRRCSLKVLTCLLFLPISLCYLHSCHWACLIV